MLASITPSPVGSLVTFITKNELRYQGLVESFDEELALQCLRCFGTEGRRLNGPQVEPQSEIGNLVGVAFKISDIKELKVLRPAPNIAPPPAPVFFMPSPSPVVPPLETVAEIRPKPIGSTTLPSPPAASTAVPQVQQAQTEPKRRAVKKAKVLIVGAGVAGLSAARELEKDEQGRFEVVLLEARDRVGGRIDTLKLPEFTDRSGRMVPSCPVDLGASYIHGCDDRHPIFKLANELGVRCDPSSSAETYADSCAWFDHKTGKQVSKRRILKIHQVMYSAANKIMEIAVEKRDQGLPDFPLSDVFEEALKYGLRAHRIKEKQFDELDRKMVFCAAKRAWQICADFTKLSALQEASWLDEEDAKAQHHDNEDPTTTNGQGVVVGNSGGDGVKIEGELKRMSDGEEERNATERPKRVKKQKDVPSYQPADRIVVDGYYDFLVKHLEVTTSPVLMNKIVKQIRSLEGRCVVRTSDKEEYEADYVIVTLPLGVLKGKSERSSVTFEPPLSKEKTTAIKTFGMGSENKVVLRFDPSDVFWPTNVPYFISTDERFRFLNLEFYGKKGVLVVHGQPPFSWNWGGLDDTSLVGEVLKSLASMLRFENTPVPQYTHVTRWDKDDFSMGSYSYFSVDSTADTVDALASCEGLKGEKRVHFAGEACSIDGHQCVHGAYTTGIEAAECIMQRFVDGKDQGPPQSGYGAYIPPEHWVQCGICKSWKVLSISRKELGTITRDEYWTCPSATCKSKMEKLKKGREKMKQQKKAKVKTTEKNKKKKIIKVKKENKTPKGKKASKKTKKTGVARGGVRKRENSQRLSTRVKTLLQYYVPKNKERGLGCGRCRQSLCGCLACSVPKNSTIKIPEKYARKNVPKSQILYE